MSLLYLWLLHDVHCLFHQGGPDTSEEGLSEERDVVIRKHTLLQGEPVADVNHNVELEDNVLPRDQVVLGHQFVIENILLSSSLSELLVLSPQLIDLYSIVC